MTPGTTRMARRGAASGCGPWIAGSPYGLLERN